MPSSPPSNTPNSRNNEKRQWRYALVISLLVHICLLLVALWAYQAPPAEVNVTVEFVPQAAAAGGAAAPPASKRKQASTQRSAQVKKVQAVTHSPKRKLNLVRRTTSPTTRSLTATPNNNTSPQPKRQQTLTQQVTQELQLKRSPRYIRPTGSSAAKTNLSLPAAAKTALGQNSSGGVPAKENLLAGGGVTSKNVSAAAAGNATGKKASGTKGSAASDSFFNWGNGTQGRKLLAKKESPLPQHLRYKGIRAQALVRFRVDKKGRPQQIEIVRSSSYPELDDWTTRYVRTFRFNSVTANLVYQAEYLQFFKP